MNRQKIYSVLLITMFVLLAGCSFIGGVFKTGVEVGVFLVIVAILVIIVLISRISRKNKTG